MGMSNNETAATFDAILRLEWEVRVTRTAAEFAPINRLRETDSIKSNARTAQARLFAAVEALSDAEAVAFGEYRSNL